MVQTVDKPRKLTAEPEYLTEVEMDASITIYNGEAVGENASTGKGRKLVAGDDFMGFALEKRTSAATGQTFVKVAQRGKVELTVTGVTLATYGVAIFASDGETFTTSSTLNSAIGHQTRFVAGTTVEVDFAAALPAT